MKLQRNFARLATMGVLVFTVAGCASYHNGRANNTLIGAGLGAATGAVFSGGDPLYVLGGAAAGGVLGNVLTQDRNYRRSDVRERGRSYGPSRGYAPGRNQARSYGRYDRYGR